MPPLKVIASAFGPALFCLLQTALPATAASLAERVEVCGGCHGADGNSSTPMIPSLAAQPEFFILNQLVLIREGVRKIPAMQEIAKGLTDEEIMSLAGHYSRLPAKPTGESVDTQLVVEGARLAGQHHCTSCHRPDLMGQEQMPRIAKQRLDYMTETLQALRDSKRDGADPLMVESVYGLSDAELKALAHYAASR